MYQLGWKKERQSCGYSSVAECVLSILGGPGIKPKHKKEKDTEKNKQQQQQQ
jgi:hypothetical protein